MAIVQISRIQQRRGLQQDLPQLASAEFGWSFDQQKLFIGNGTIEEGAPIEGVTEILTEKSDIFSLLNAYNFKGYSGGYRAVTGPDSLHPVTRTLQDKLDDTVSVKDFGAKGDGSADDTTAIQRAIQQIYNPSYNPGVPQVRRAIYFPAGVYKTSATIYVPAYVMFKGDGHHSSIIRADVGTVPVLQTTDHTLTGLSPTNTLPRDIVLTDIKLQNTDASVSRSLLVIDSTVNVRMYGVGFETTTSSTTNSLVSITDTVSKTDTVLFNKCSFLNAAYGVNVAVTGNGVNTISIQNSYFDGITHKSVDIDPATNSFVSVNNRFGNVATAINRNNNVSTVSVGDSYSDGTQTGIALGGLKEFSSNTASVVNGTNTITTLANGAGEFTYQLNSGSNYRFGTVKYTSTGNVVTFVDDYTETGTSLAANLYVGVISNVATVTCTLSSSATLQYNIRQYV